MNEADQRIDSSIETLTPAKDAARSLEEPLTIPPAERRDESGETVQDTWTRHITEWESSGLSQAEYCRRRGLGIHRFYYWRRKLYSVPDSPGVTLVQIAGDPRGVPLGRPWSGLCVRVGAYGVDVSERFSPVALAEVVQVLRRQ